MTRSLFLAVVAPAVFVCLSSTANAAFVVEEQLIHEPAQANIDGGTAEPVLTAHRSRLSHKVEFLGTLKEKI